MTRRKYLFHVNLLADTERERKKERKVDWRAVTQRERQRAFFHYVQFQNTQVILNPSMPRPATAMTDAPKLNIDFGEQGRRA